MDAVLEVCLQNVYKKGLAQVPTDIESFVDAVQTDVLSSMSLLLNRVMAHEPESFIQGSHFVDIV